MKYKISVEKAYDRLGWFLVLTGSLTSKPVVSYLDKIENLPHRIEDLKDEYKHLGGDIDNVDWVIPEIKITHAGGRPSLYSEEILIKSKEYLDSCKDITANMGTQEHPYFKTVVKLPKIEELAFVLGVHRDTLYEWSKEYPEFSDTLDKIKQKQANELIDKGLSGDYNPTIAKLMLSSNHGYKERTDQTTNDKDLTIPVTDPKAIELAKRYEEELRKTL